MSVGQIDHYLGHGDDVLLVVKGGIVDGVVLAVEGLFDVVDEVVAVQFEDVLDLLHQVEDV